MGHALRRMKIERSADWVIGLDPQCGFLTEEYTYMRPHMAVWHLTEDWGGSIQSILLQPVRYHVTKDWMNEVTSTMVGIGFAVAHGQIEDATIID